MPVSYAGTVSEHNATRNAVGLFDVSHLGKALVRGPGAARVRQLRAHQRPGPHRPGQGAIHVVLHRIRRRHRRPDRLLRRRRRDLSGAQRRQHRRGGRGAAGRRTGGPDDHQRASLLRGAGGAGAAIGRRARGSWDCRPTWITWATPMPRTRECRCAFVAPGTPASTATNCCRPGSPRVWCSTRWSRRSTPPAASPRAWAPATRCAPRWATRCTATNFRSTSRRCRPGAAGRSAGRRTRSSAATRCWPRRKPGRDGCCAGCGWSGRGVLRPGLTVLARETPVGVTTSGTFSPTLQVGIALALIDTDAGIDDGQQITVDVRGRAVECEVVRPPFVAVKTR